MSIVNFAAELAKLSAQVQRNTQELNNLKNTVEGVKGPMDQLISLAEQAGSAVANINGVMVEMVSLNQSNWQPSLQGVVWQLYEVQRAAEETKSVSRDLLDQIVPLIDERMPNFSLWLKKILQMAADGEITFDEMQQKIDDFVSSVGVTQLNTLYGNDVPGFIIEFRKLMEQMKNGQKTIDDVGTALDRVTGRAREAARAVEQTTGGKTTQGSGGSTSKGSTSLGDPRNATNQTAAMLAAIEAAKRR